MSKNHLTDTPFSDFKLPPEVTQGLDIAGFSLCTPIQAATLPLVLNNQDVIGKAQTGTGKTAAFLVALLNRLLLNPTSSDHQKNQPRALVLAPTRELAIQIEKDAQQLAQFSGLNIGLAYGGTGYTEQREKLEQGVDILIGTPGRVIDYMKQHVFNLKALQVLVLDEADRMFDLGFLKDIRFVLHRMPEPDKRLSMLFSATLTYRVTELAYEHMNNPQTVEIETKQVTGERITESVYYTSNDEKIPLLLGLIQRDKPHKAIIFCNTKRSVDRVGGFLLGNDLHAEILTGDVPQSKRQRLLAEFTEGKFPYLIATDVAARGIHVDDISHVFNFDLPEDSEEYVHRIGRTARAGASGDAISFACEDFAMALMDIEEFIGHKIPLQPMDESLLVTPKPARIIKRSAPPTRNKAGNKGRNRPNR